MGILTYLGFGGVPRRLFVYTLRSTAGGEPGAVPIGTMPAPPKRYEDYLRTSHMLTYDQFVPAQYYQDDVVVLWAGDMIAAICFLESGAAQGHEGFEQLTRQELSGRFDHFVGMRISRTTAALPAHYEPSDGDFDNRYEVV